MLSIPPHHPYHPPAPGIPLQKLDLHLPDPAPPGLFRLLRGSRRIAMFWTFNILFWLGVWLVGMFLGIAFRSPLPDVAAAMWLRVGTGLVMTAGLREIYRLPVLRENQRMVKPAVAACCCLTFAVVEFLILQIMAEAGVPLPETASMLATRLVFARVLILLVWSAIYFGFHFLEDQHALEMRAARAELAAREHELRHVQSQMNPQFLFNALDVVRACRYDPESVDEVTRGVADYLRFLFLPTRPLEPLHRELDALQKLLTVQTSRFRGSLVFRSHCDPGTRNVMVPPMLIQPLLEDAFHDRPDSDGPALQIWLTATTVDGCLKLTHSHTHGTPACRDSGHPERDGIRTLRQRLELQLGPAASVEREVAEAWVRVTVSIPLPA